MKTIKELNLRNKKVLIRCDFNVPIKNGKIIDDTRIKASLETINYCIEKNAKVILFSHLGRIKTEEDKKNKSLKAVAQRLEKLLNRKVIFINETRGKKLETSISNMKNKDIILVENTRFEDYPEKLESSNDKELGKYWSLLGDVFINDAFGTIHRAHASNVGISSNIESAVGFLVEKELSILSSLKKPEKPFIIILGGAKVSDKVGVINNLIKKADKILIGGGMANTFLSSEGFNLGNSLVDYDSINFCKKLIEKYPKKIILPVDLNVSDEYSNDAKNCIKDIIDIDDNDMALDIGSKTIKLYEKYLSDAKTVFWNGPLGVYEFTKYKKGTNKILKYLVDNDIKTILGGGDIVGAASNSKLKDKVYHASTGGGATLEYLEGKKLPGIEILK